jgi:hypothetical protein
VEWTAARNEKTRERFWEVDTLNEDGKHVNITRFAYLKVENHYTNYFVVTF